MASGPCRGMDSHCTAPCRRGRGRRRGPAWLPRARATGDNDGDSDGDGGGGGGGGGRASEVSHTRFISPVAACTVVMMPSARPNASSTTAASGARQWVVHEALDTTWWTSGSYLRRVSRGNRCQGGDGERSREGGQAHGAAYRWWLTPTTKVGVSSSFAGAEITTLRAPPRRAPWLRCWTALPPQQG